MKRIRLFTEDNFLQIWRSVCRGRFATIGFFFLFGLMIYTFLFLTIHKREGKPMPGYKSMDSRKADFYRRWEMTIDVWINDGFFKQAGLCFLYPLQRRPKQTLWNTYPGDFLLFAYIVQRIHYYLRGKVSRLLMCFLNLAIVWFSSSLLGFLAFRICSRLLIPPLRGLLLGISAQTIYQTFPYNLRTYWETRPSVTMCLCVIIFLIVLERMLREGPVPKWVYWACALAVFAMFRIEYIGALFIIVTLYLSTMIMKPKLLYKWKHFLTIVLPACLAVGLFIGQLTYVKLSYPEVQFVGSSFMFRTGFDGSTRFYDDHSYLLTGYKNKIIGERRSTPWGVFFIAGTLSILTFAVFSLRDQGLRQDIIIITTALGLYVLTAFLFSQSVVIHPDVYDRYLAISMTLGLFVYFPCILERVTKHTGLFIIIFVLIAFCYSMVQLRTYAIAVS